MITEPESKNISLRIPPNYSTWQTIELTYYFCKDAVDKGIEGDFVECGVAAGNNFGAMLLAGRKGWGFDSFEGIPWCSDKDDIQPGMSGKPKFTKGESSGISSHSMEGVISNLEIWGCGDNYELVKGWFKDTIPNNKIEKIAVLRLDGDLYESTMTPLKYLYSKLSIGGYLIIDDWELGGCRKAFYEFFSENSPELIYQKDSHPAYFKKTKQL